MKFSKLLGALIPVFLVIFNSFSLFGQETDAKFLSVKPSPGDGILSLLARYHLLDSCSKRNFFEKNQLAGSDGLNLSKFYQLPIKTYEYNGKSIRSTIGINDYQQARQIEAYNDSVHIKGIKNGDYRIENTLWVPQYLIQCYDSIDSDQALVLESKEEEIEVIPTVTFPLLGKEDEVIDIRSDKLGNHIYYLVSGHGGPDPGAMGKYNDCDICEDEYAYDIVLRLANNLIRHGAEVYVIIQDKNDGIRNDAVLSCDNDEVCYGGAKIPRNQVQRLKQRTDTINNLYRRNRKANSKIQRLMVFHVDSRKNDQRVDMFFYHARNSRSGRKMAENLRVHIDEKYGMHQKTRGYDGSVKTRSLYLVRNTLPTTVYVELGNLQNEKDQKRFLLQTNRQAIANWFSEGIMKHEASVAK